MHADVISTTHVLRWRCIYKNCLEMVAGIWPESKVFNDDGLGPIPTRWKGHCESGQLFNGSINCNKKLIGAKYFIDGFLAENKAPFNTTENPDYLSPRDVNGHGTLVSSIAAGSFVANATYKGLASGTVRGGAPHARIAMYKAFWNVPFPAGQASSADVLQAFDEAIKDGVDVLSLSFGNQIPLYSEVDVHDVVSIGTFHAVARGIHVVSAAGNEGPTQQTVTNVAPWILTVAASSIDRSFPTPITLGNNITILVCKNYLNFNILLKFSLLITNACFFPYITVSGARKVCRKGTWFYWFGIPRSTSTDPLHFTRVRWFITSFTYLLMM